MADLDDLIGRLRFAGYSDAISAAEALTRLRDERVALRKLAEEFLESPPDDADGYWENFSKRLCAALAGATED